MSEKFCHTEMYNVPVSSAIHACVLMKTLLQNYIAQDKCPPEMLKPHSSGGMISALSCMLNEMSFYFG